ncbi:MAG: hypothetical protein HQL56_05785 [Magnetococcales bacterium]|nr:hypothetical protein [Magnetococcales bacterium]
MLAEEYFHFKQTLENKGILFSYCGQVSESLLAALGETLRRRMAQESTDVNTTRRVFSVFVELVQNVIRYGAEEEAEAAQEALHEGIVVVGHREERYFVVCANLVETREVPRLKERLERLNGMNRDELKLYYMEKLRNGPEDTSLGATVGLIEIMRRATLPVNFDFHDIGNGMTFFCIQVNI